MNDNDILKYRKHNFEDIKDILETMKDPKKVSRTLLNNLFSNVGKKLPDGTTEVRPPKYRITDYFDIPANMLVNQPKAVKNTTFGLFLYNAFVLADLLKDTIEYINVAIDGDNFETIVNALGTLILHQKLPMEVFSKFCSRTVWLGYQSELFMPGMSVELIIPNKEVKKLKVKLLNENPEFLERNTIDITQVGKFGTTIEAPLLEEAARIRKENYAGRLYDMGKPTFGNNYKNMNVINGVLPDPVTGTYKINENCYNEGINDWNFDMLANKTMSASYARGVGTQVGGTYAKYVGIMMQTLRAGPKNSDCDTKMYVNFEVTKKNREIILYTYGLIDGKLTMISDPISRQLVGKTIKIRSPLFCKMKDCLCNKCLGDKFYLLGIENIGLTTNIPLDSQKLKSMKSMHDMTIKPYPVNPKEYMEFVR